MGSRITLVGAVSAAGLTLLSGCGGAGEVIATGDDVVLVSERTGDGMDAMGGGRLEMVGGCLGARGVVIVWPHGTEVVGDDPLTDDIEPGPYEVAGVTVPAACAKHDIFLSR